MNKKKRFWNNLKDFYKGFGQGVLDGLKIYVPLVAILSLIVAAFEARE